MIVGLHYITSFSEAGDVWQDFFKSDMVSKLNTLSDFNHCDDIDENDGIGFMYGFEDTDNFNYHPSSSLKNLVAVKNMM